MIVEFKVKNFLSIKDEQTLSFEATVDKHLRDIHCIRINPKLSLLKIAAIFGANASGKSNILKALSFMHRMILDSAAGKQILDQTDFVPFKLSRDTLEAPGTFEITFVQEKIKFIYGFKINRYAVLEEWLFNYPKGKKSKLFTRKAINKNHQTYDYDYDWGAAFKGEKKKLSELTRQNSLFLSVSSQFKHPLLNKIFEWFKLKMRPLVTPGTDIFNFTSSKCRKDEGFKKNILRLLKYADFRIDDILFEKIRLKEQDILDLPMGEKLVKSMIKDKNSQGQVELNKILFKHNIKEEDGSFSNNLEFFEESRGTQRYYEIAGPLLDVINQGGVIYIDELESSLHTKLLTYLIKTFLENSKEAQLIFTSHDLQVMDLEILRRDEVWFTEMKVDGQTELYCLSDFHPRKDKLIRGGYISGAYGAVPIIRSYKQSYGS
jgi:AAA15 family ATPase/GTPase